MVNIKDIIDDLFFIIFKRYIFRTQTKNKENNDEEEIWILKDLE